MDDTLLSLTPDWVSTTEENKEVYYTFSTLMQKRNINISFYIHSIGLYLYAIGYLIYIILGSKQMMGAIGIALGVSILTLTTIYILYKFNRHGLSVRRYFEMYSMLPTLSRLFMISGFSLTILSIASFAFFEYPIQLTFRPILYSSIPIIISLINITITYPLRRYRRTLRNKTKSEKENLFEEGLSNQTEDSNLDYKTTHPILESIASQNQHPLALTYEQIGFLKKHNLIEDYFELYED